MFMKLTDARSDETIYINLSKIYSMERPKKLFCKLWLQPKPFRGLPRNGSV